MQKLVAERQHGGAGGESRREKRKRPARARRAAPLRRQRGDLASELVDAKTVIQPALMLPNGVRRCSVRFVSRAAHERVLDAGAGIVLLLMAGALLPTPLGAGVLPPSPAGLVVGREGTAAPLPAVLLAVGVQSPELTSSSSSRQQRFPLPE